MEADECSPWRWDCASRGSQEPDRRDSVDAPVDMNVSLGPCYIRDFSVTAWRSWDEITILVIGLAPRVISDGNVRVIGMTLPPKTGPS